MQDCIFCKIIKKQIPAKIVFEDDVSLAFLDVNPRSTGMCIVIPKQHYTEFDENFDLSNRVLQNTMLVAEMIKQSLEPKAVDFAMIPSEAVQHFHTRVYPVYENEIPLIENQPKQVTETELNDVQKKLSSAAVDVKFPIKAVVEHVEEKTKEKKPKDMKKGRSKKAVYWMRREMEVG